MKRNQIYLATGKIFSTLGDSIYGLIIIWYIYQMTHSTIYTGLAFLLIYLAQALHFFVGAIIEKSDKKGVLVYAQLMQFILMCIIPILIILNLENLYVFLVIIFLVSVLENLQGTSEMSIAATIMSNDELSRYNSFTNSISQFCNLIITALFSYIILYFSVENIYLINAIVFLIAAIMFAKIKYQNVESDLHEESGFLTNLSNGINYFKKSVFIWITFPLAFINAALSGLNAVLPKYAEELGNENLYGWLIFAVSGGILIGNLISPIFTKIKVGYLVGIMSFTIFSLLILSYYVHNPLLSIFILGLALVPLGVINIVLLTFTQIRVEKKYLARVLTISESILFIFMPIGAIVGGFMAQILNASIFIFISGFTFLAISLIFVLSNKLKNLPPIKEKE